MRFLKVKLTRSENESCVVEIPAWEVPVLQFVHGPEKCEVIGVTSNAKDYPDAQVEFDRLARRYKSDSKSDVDYVASVYGQGSPGVEKLAEAIAAEQAEDAVGEEERELARMIAAEEAQKAAEAEKAKAAAAEKAKFDAAVAAEVAKQLAAKTEGEKAQAKGKAEKAKPEPIAE